MGGWTLAVLGAGGLLLAANALRPLKWWPVRALSFVAQLLVAELAPWLALGLAAGSAALALRAPWGWPAAAGLAAAAGAVGLLGLQVRLAMGARDEVLAFLARAGLPAPGPRRWRRALLPRWLNGAGVERFTDLRYAPGGGTRRLLDVYRSKAGARGAPVLLQIHGGAWCVGSKRAQGRPIINRMAAAGWVVVAINYRLSPWVRFPAHLVDCKLALKWIREHIAEYGGDPSRVVVTGGSAGGHLAALLALTQNQPEFQPGFEQVDTRVLAAVPVYGPFDLEAVLAHTGPGLRRLAQRIIFDGQMAKASPLGYVRADAVPMLVVQGTADNLVPAPLAHAFVKALEAAGNANVHHLEVPGGPHAFDVFFSLRSEAVGAGVQAFLEWVVREQPATAASAVREEAIGSLAATRS